MTFYSLLRDNYHLMYFELKKVAPPSLLFKLKLICKNNQRDKIRTRRFAYLYLPNFLCLEASWRAKLGCTT